MTKLGALKKIAKKIALACSGGEVIYLSGELGAGKTTFVQYLALALGVRGVVNSPTFLVLKEYQGKNLTLAHADCYRAGGVDDIISTGLLDMIGMKKTVCAIEWPEKVPELEAQAHIHLKFKIGEKMRNLMIEWHDEGGEYEHFWSEITS